MSRRPRPVRLRDLPADVQAMARVQLGPNSPLLVAPRARPVQREASEQRQVIAWADDPATRTRYPGLAWLFHVPNAGVAGGGRRGAYLKAQGVRSGVPDLWLPMPSGPFRGCVIELKSPTGRASTMQRDWLLALTDFGWAASIETGAAAAIARLTWYLEGARQPNSAHASKTSPA